MVDKNLLKLALLHKEYVTVSYLMLQLAAGYLEGEMESSKITFNEFFPTLPVEVLRLMIHDNTFTCVTEICSSLLKHKS